MADWDTSETGGGGDNSCKTKRSKNKLAAAKDKPPIVETKRKVHAQRKFAQGAGSLTNSPHSSPLKELSSRVRPRDTGSTSSSSSSGPSILQKGERPKTEDFLTFLCLRGTEYLPPELGFFNQVSHFNNAGTSNDSFSDTDDDDLKKKRGVAKKTSLGRKLAAKDKKSHSNPTTPKNKDHIRRDLSLSNQRGTRAASQDSGSSVDRKSVERSSTTSGSAKKLGIREKKCEVRLTRSKLSPKTKAEAIAAGGGSSVSKKKKSAKESEREKRARLREQVKEQEEEEDGDSSDWSEGEEGEGQEEGKEEEEGGKSDSDLEADEEASSRESSRRPSTRRSQGGPTKARSVSKEESHPPQDSKEDLTALLAPSRPSRKTKEAAKSYLNLLGQKLAGKKRDAETEVPLRLTASPEPSPPRTTAKKSAETIDKDVNKEVEEVKEIEEVKEEIKVEEDDSNSAESLATKVDDTSSNGSKSPRGLKSKEEKDQLRKERKDKKKSKTSLKDLQNILLEEAKRKISDTPSSTKTSSSSVGKTTTSSTPAESECTTPDLDTDRIVISQKTGYINVKPRHSSVEDNLNKASPPLTVQQRRNSLSNSTHSRLSGGKLERTVTPPRKILPKCEDSETRNSVESPNSAPKACDTVAVSGGSETGSHLPAGLRGAAVITSRVTGVVTTSSVGQQQSVQSVHGASGARSTPPVTILNTPNPLRPLSIQTTVQQDIKTNIPLTVPNSSSYSSQIQQQQQEQGQPQQGQPLQAQPQQVHLNVPDPTKSQTILFPAHSQHNQIRMSGEMPGGGIPVHVQGMAGMPAGMTSLQVGVRQPSGAVAYQTIPVIGPGGIQYSIPVQQMPPGLAAAAAGGPGPITMASLPAGSIIPIQPQPTVSGSQNSAQLGLSQVQPQPITVPSIPISVDTGGGGAARHPTIVTVPSYVRPGTTGGYATYTDGNTGGGQQVQVVGTPPQAQQSTEAASSLPQTITMPSGTTIQYNAMPVQPSTTAGSALSGGVVSVPAISPAVSTVQSTSSTLISPGPPVLSPQISKPNSARSQHSKKSKIPKSDSVPPLLTPPTHGSKKQSTKAMGSTSSQVHQPLEICVDDSNSPPPAASMPPATTTSSTSFTTQPPITTAAATSGRSDSPTKSSTSTVRSTASQNYGYSQQQQPTQNYQPQNLPQPVYHAPLHVDPYQPQQAVAYQTSPYDNSAQAQQQQQVYAGSPVMQSPHHPGNVQASPHHMASPHHQMVSPQQLQIASPHHQMASPQHFTSPHHPQMISPHHIAVTMASPHHQMVSPHHTMPSPHNTMHSPHYTMPSPHHHGGVMNSPHHAHASQNQFVSPVGAIQPGTETGVQQAPYPGGTYHEYPPYTHAYAGVHYSYPHEASTQYSQPITVVSAPPAAVSSTPYLSHTEATTQMTVANTQMSVASTHSGEVKPPRSNKEALKSINTHSQVATGTTANTTTTTTNQCSPRTSTVQHSSSHSSTGAAGGQRTPATPTTQQGATPNRKQHASDSTKDATKSSNVAKRKVDPEYQTHDKNKTEQSQRAANSAASSGGGSSLPNSATKKRTEKFGKSKTTSITHKPITQFNVDDDKSSPYAFDFDSPDTVTPQVPHFRKSASPLKPTPPATHTPTTTGGQMLKRSKASLSGFISDPSTSGHYPTSGHSSSHNQDTSSTSKSLFSRGETSRITASFNLAADASVSGSVLERSASGVTQRSSGSRSSSISVGGADYASNRDDKKSSDTTEDGSSSDNETTYFIPLETEGQSFGVAVKLGTDGPSGPNQKVIMTAKLVTNPDKKPINAKILGSKTIESKVKICEGGGKDSPSASYAHTTSTPRKVRMPVASPVSPVYPLDEHISPIQDKIKPSRIRRTDDAIPSTSQARDPGSVRRALHSPPPVVAASAPKASGFGGEPRKRRPKCLIGTVHTEKQFPRLGQHAQMMQAPVFRPTEAEFKDPLRYIQRIRRHAEPFGMCKIIPPKSFKPECNVEDELRFTAYNQYINRMHNRWGPNAKETAAIKKYLDTQNVDTRAHPLVGGLEVDLPALYHAVQSFGGLSEVIQKKKWNKIAEYIRVARGGSHASANKLDDIYVKWLLPYDTLSSVEREELLRLVEEEWAERSREKLEKSRQQEQEDKQESVESESESESEEECVVKGKSTSLAAFYRLSRNLLTTVFRDVENPLPHEVEDEYWKIVAERDVHLQVCQGSIDTGLIDGYGFPIRNSVYASHPWNLKNLSRNPRSVLQALGNVMGVTVPTLHVSMLLTTSCWYRDPHALPWIEYLHTGSSKIWYGIPDHHSLAFYTAMKQLVPGFCKNRKIWLPSDTTMVSPSLLVKHGVSVARTVQHPGQFILIFPKSYTSSISTGYSVSESVYFATSDWLQEIDVVFQDIRDSMEPMMFPPEKMLISVAKFKGATKSILLNVKNKLEIMNIRELSWRDKITAAGIKKLERLKLEREDGEEDDEYECHVCNTNLYLSMIANEEEDQTFCLPHGLQHIKSNKKRLRQSKLMYLLTRDELKQIVTNLSNRISSGQFAKDPPTDPPLKLEDLADVNVDESGDECGDDETEQPRQRALPSFIKKEIASSSEETDDETETEVEEVKHQRTIGPEDYSVFQDCDEEDIPLVEALFLENDEIIRPSERRQKPRWRKPPSESEDSESDEAESEGEQQTSEKPADKKTAKKAPPPPKPQKTAQPKKLLAAAAKNTQPPTAAKGKQGGSGAAAGNKRKRENSSDSIEIEAIIEAPKKKINNKDQKTKVTAVKDPKAAVSKKNDEEIKSEKKPLAAKAGIKRKDESPQPAAKKGKKIATAAEVSKQAAPAKPKADAKSTPAKKKPAVVCGNKEQTASAKKKKVAEDTGSTAGSSGARRNSKHEIAPVVTKKRRSKKRKAKTMDAADKFNLLDIILTETDDEMPVSASEEGSESSSSEEEWK